VDKLVWDNCIGLIVDAMLTVDDAEEYQHAPVSVQVVGRRLRVEQVLEIVSDALHKHFELVPYELISLLCRG